MVHQQYQFSSSFRRKLEPGGDLLSIERARLRMMACTGGFPGIMQQERQVKHVGILNLQKKRFICCQFRVLCIDERVQLLNANQGMFVRGVPVKKLVLHQTGQIAEFGQISSQEIHLVHHTENVSDLAFPGQDGRESFSGGSCVLGSAIYQPGTPTNQLLELRTQFHFTLLRVEEDPHQTEGIFVKYFPTLEINEPAMTVKSVKLFGLQF